MLGIPSFTQMATDEQRDIYTKPKGKAEPETLPAPEIDPGEQRVRARKRTIWLSSIMLVLLTAIAIYFFVQDPKSNPMLDLLRGGTNRVTREGPRVLPVATIPAAPQETSSFNLASLDFTTPSTNIPPEKIAQVMTLLRQAEQLMRAREFDRAEELARQSLEIWPGVNAGLRTLGTVYLQRGQFDQAILVLERALRDDPFNVSTFNNLAIAYMQRGQLDRAEDLLLSAVQIQPDIPSTQINLGLLYVLWGRYDQAVEHLEPAVGLLPNNRSAVQNLGVSLMRMGRIAEAREQFRRVLEMDPSRPSPYFNMASALVLERSYDEAMNWLRQGVKRCTPVEARKYLMDTDFDSLRTLPEFQSLVRDLTDPGVGVGQSR